MMLLLAYEGAELELAAELAGGYAGILYAMLLLYADVVVYTGVVAVTGELSELLDPGVDSTELEGG
jgi:hypothetical protein